eukprot:COSAG02_NODE_14786_length_1236_cov_2.193492_2_plen_99_part_00
MPAITPRPTGHNARNAPQMLLESYGPKLCTAQMNTMRAEFLDGSYDQERFWNMFEATQNMDDQLPSAQVNAAVISERLHVTSRRYNRWLLTRECNNLH